jgi:hypothetical protein
LAQGSICDGRSAPPPVYDHVIWIWMENHSFGDVIGNRNAPFETDLAGRCGTATKYSDVGDPSLPNYIGATSGDAQQISDDAPPSEHVLTVDNLFRQVRATGGTERSYAESMNENCQVTSRGQYDFAHNPALYYVGGDDRTACRADDVPMGTNEAGQLRHDLDTNSLPTFAFVTPDLCNDTHDCSVRTGDDWLRAWLDLIVSSDSYRAGRTAIFVVWDENTPMPFIVVSPSTPSNTVVDNPVDHYALLRTTEEMLGISTFLGQAKDATSLRSAFRL